jgi:hypothetical protein
MGGHDLLGQVHHAGHLIGQRRAYQTAGQLLLGDDVPTFI